MESAKSEEPDPHLSIEINNFNPLNQRPGYDPSKIDKSMLKPVIFTIPMQDVMDLKNNDSSFS